MEHTQGKMTVGGNLLDDCIKIGDELIGVIYPCDKGREGEALANARRLAAAWNACSGVETERLEQDNLQGYEPWGHVQHLQAQRDALLAALEALFADYKQLADSGDAGNWKLEDQDVGKQAMAAIAVAKGGAATIEDLQRLSNERQMTPECAARIVGARKAKDGEQ